MKPSELYEALHALIANACRCTSGAHAASASHKSLPRSRPISSGSFSISGRCNSIRSICAAYLALIVSYTISSRP